MKKNPPGYMTTPGERQSYWTYFIGQNSYYYITATFLSTYLAIAGIFYLFYKLNDKDVQIMAKCNSGEITREEAERQLSRKY